MKPLSILLVEDNPADVILTQEVLKKSGLVYALEIAEDGEEALSCLRDKLQVTPRKLPDLILLDLNLPKKNGHEVLAAIRQDPELSELPVAILTTSDEIEDVRRASDLRANCYVTKPPNLENLAKILEVMEYVWMTLGTAASQSSETDQVAAKATQKDAPIRVLLIEDNPADALYLNEALKVKGRDAFKVQVAEDLTSAVDVLKKQEFDVILCDLGLPDAQGLDVLVKLKEHGIPIVILTGHDNEELGAEALKLGAQDYLIKGESTSQLLTRSIRYSIERKRAEQLAQLTVTMEQTVLHSVLEQAPLCVVLLNPLFRIADVNSSFCNEVNLSKGEVLGKDVFELLPTLPSEPIVQTIRNGVPCHLEQCVIEVGSEADNRRQKYWDIAAWPIKGRDQPYAGGVVVATDVTQRIEAEQHHADYLATLAHDIKNPLIGEQRLLELLLGGSLGELSPQQAEVLSVMGKSNLSLLNLLKDLLEVYRYATLSAVHKFEDLDLGALANECAEENRPLMELSGISLVCNIPPDLNHAWADQLAIRRLLNNLLQNALKFSSATGTIELSACNADGFVMFSVKDTGIGMAPEEQSKLFQRFWQGELGRKNPAGTGLGLFLSWQIVKAHNGTIACSSELNQGTTFTVQLPTGNQEKIR